MAQLTKAQADNLGSISRTHIADEKQLLQVALWPPYVHHGMHTHLHIHDK